MSRTRKTILVILGIAVLPLVLIALPFFIAFAWLFTRPVRLSRTVFARRLREAESGAISEKRWKRFADRRIADERLDAIRIKARLAGPPRADRLMLRQLIGEAEKLSS